MIRTFKDAHLLALSNDRKLVEAGIKKWWSRGRVDDYVKTNGNRQVRSIYVTSSEIRVELEEEKDESYEKRRHDGRQNAMRGSRRCLA